MRVKMLQLVKSHGLVLAAGKTYDVTPATVAYFKANGWAEDGDPAAELAEPVRAEDHVADAEELARSEASEAAQASAAAVPVAITPHDLTLGARSK